MIEPINGGYYPLWSQFVTNKDRWIGKRLVEEPDGLFSTEPAKTTITDIKIYPNGTDSAMFEVVGEKFSCAADVHYLGISGRQDHPGWIAFSAIFGLDFRIECEKNVE